METAIVLASLIISFAAIGLVIYLIRESRSKEGATTAEDSQQKLILEELQKQNQQKQSLENNESILKIQEQQEDLKHQFSRLERQEENIHKQLNLLEVREERLKDKEEELEQLAKTLEAQKEEQKKQLEHISNLTSEEAKELLFEQLEKQLSRGISQRIKAFENYYQEQSEKMATKVLAQAIQRCAVDHVVESTVSVLTLPSEDMKGRIIGREGRNIRAIEMITGVELLIDDTPEVVVISSFDPIRREIARRALERLIEDGRIHPTRIEEVVENVKKELDDYLTEEGEAAVMEVGIQSLHPEIVKLLGRLRYRSSYGQNILQHSKEVAYVAGLMAEEIGANVQVARRAGLLHDLGKALTYEEVGTHTALGIDFARRYNESPKVLHAMAAHHFDVEPQSVEAVLVQVADTLSAARPGARSEPVERYMQRMNALEDISSSFEGVEKSYVIQAGREIRVIVHPDVITEDEMIQLSHKIAQKIEKELEYPGQIKVSIIRETRTASYAK